MYNCSMTCVVLRWAEGRHFKHQENNPEEDRKKDGRLTGEKEYVRCPVLSQ